MKMVSKIGILLLIVGIVFSLFGGLLGAGIVPVIEPISSIANTPPLQPIYFAGLAVLGLVMLIVGMRR